jgi:4-hydroxy-tetrahydrodipicolinate synthase
MFTGTYTAIVTPFRNGVLDEPALERLVKAQIKGGVDGIVPVGTTGESPTLDYEEHIRVIELAVQFADGKVKVLAGTGGNSTSEAIYLTKAAEEAGADGSPTTTSRRRTVCSSISARSRTIPSCRLCSTAFRAAAASRLPWTP